MRDINPEGTKQPPGHPGLNQVPALLWTNCDLELENITHSFIHSFNKCPLSSSSTTGSVLESADKFVNKTEKFLIWWLLHYNKGGGPK